MFSKWQTLFEIFLNVVGILLGFFLSVTLSAILGQTGDWVILSSGILTAFLEICSFFVYNLKKKFNFVENFNKYKEFILIVNFFNNLKIGVFYGFFVEAFKLGS
uniref:Hypothetical plastid protein ycf20 n=1 Tax=Cryptomonas sp. SAG 977-2f TaxID=279061 RepID=A0A679CC51_9CRYP|nr:hypothetical plastid protein ycf20 [Cryptomonas sp. SAG 977-2f]